ncbi:hypothetical protein JCM3770_002017 [Rhodotorula araucariae]
MDCLIDKGSPLKSLASSSDCSTPSARPTGAPPPPPPPTLATEQSFATSEHADVLDLAGNFPSDECDLRAGPGEAVQDGFAEDTPVLDLQDDVEMSTVELGPDQRAATMGGYAALFGEELEIDPGLAAAELDGAEDDDKVVLVDAMPKIKQDVQGAPDSPSPREAGFSPLYRSTSESPLLDYSRNRDRGSPQILGANWEPSGRFAHLASSPCVSRVPAPEPPLTPRSHATASRFNPFRFAYAHSATPPPEAEVWQYTLRLPFHGMGGRLIGPHGQVALDIRARARACEVHVLFREDGVAHCVITGSRASIARSLALIQQVAYGEDPTRIWSQDQRLALAQTDPRWCELNGACMERFPGFWLKEEYIDSAAPGAGSRSKNYDHDLGRYDQRWASVYDDTQRFRHEEPHREEPAKDRPSQVVREGRLSRSPAPPDHSRYQSTSAALEVHSEPRYSVSQSEKHKRQRSPSQSRAGSPRRGPLPTPNTRVKEEVHRSVYSIPIPVSAISLFVGANASGHFIKQTTGVNIQFTGDLDRAALVLEPQPGADRRVVDKARALVDDVLASIAPTALTPSQRDRGHATPRTRATAASREPLSPRERARPHTMSPRSYEEREDRAPRGRDEYGRAHMPSGDGHGGECERDKLRERSPASHARRRSGLSEQEHEQEQEHGGKYAGGKGLRYSGWTEERERGCREKEEGERVRYGRGMEEARLSADHREHRRDVSPRRHERDDRLAHRGRYDRDNRDYGRGYRSPPPTSSRHEPRYAPPAALRPFVSEGYPPPRGFDVGGAPLHIEERRGFVLTQASPERRWDRAAQRSRDDGSWSQPSAGWGQRGVPWHQEYSSRRRPEDFAPGGRGRA